MAAKKLILISLSSIILMTGYALISRAERKEVPITLQVTSMDPLPGSKLIHMPDSIRISFNKPLSDTSVNPESYRLLRSGGDGIFGNANDVVLESATPVLMDSTTLVIPLPMRDIYSDFYRVILSGEDAGYLRFDGVNDLVNLPDSLISSTRSLTLEMRCRASAPGVFFGYQDAAYPAVPHGFVPAIYLGLDNRLRGKFFSGLPTNPITEETPYTNGEWMNLALVSNTNTQSFYKNGHLIGSQAGTIQHSNIIKNQIGTGYIDHNWPAYPTGWFPISGDISELRLWHVARTPEQIDQDFESPLQGNETGLVGDWDFRKGSGQILADRSQNQNDGVLGTMSGTDTSDPRWIAKGIRDVSGSPLDGEFSGTFPTGDGVPSGAFQADFLVDLGIQVLEPNGGEVWIWGSVHSIRWLAPNVNNIHIEASSDNGASWFVVTPITANDGEYAWETPLIPSDKYRVQISDYDVPSASDTSDGLFTIERGSINITQPNGGEKWPAGSTQTVQWTSNGTVGQIKIEASSNGGTSWFIVEAAEPNTGSYEWKTPQIQSTDFHLRLSDVVYPQIMDVSDKPFALYYLADDERADVNQDGFVDFRDILRIHDNWHKQVSGNPR